MICAVFLCDDYHLLFPVVEFLTAYRDGRHGRTIEVSSLLHIADDRSRWATITAEASVGIHQRRLGVTGVSYI